MSYAMTARRTVWVIGIVVLLIAIVPGCSKDKPTDPIIPPGDGYTGDSGNSGGNDGGGYSPPSAAFSASPKVGFLPVQVKFTNQSTGTISSYYWSFGDGTSSTAKSPVHTYTKAGNFAVTLKVKGPAGSDTEQKTNYIRTQPFAAFSNVRWTSEPQYGQVALKADLRICGFKGKDIVVGTYWYISVSYTHLTLPTN